MKISVIDKHVKIHSLNYQHTKISSRINSVFDRQYYILMLECRYFLTNFLEKYQ